MGSGTPRSQSKIQPIFPSLRFFENGCQSFFMCKLLPTRALSPDILCNPQANSERDAGRHGRDGRNLEGGAVHGTGFGDGGGAVQSVYRRRWRRRGSRRISQEKEADRFDHASQPSDRSLGSSAFGSGLFRRYWLGHPTRLAEDIPEGILQAAAVFQVAGDLHEFMNIDPE